MQAYHGLSTETAVMESSRCSIQFKDESILMCYFSKCNMAPHESKGLILLQHMLHYYFPNCSFKHIRSKDMSQLPELRFNRRCFFMMDDFPNNNEISSKCLIHIQPNDMYWGYYREDVHQLYNGSIQSFIVTNIATVDNSQTSSLDSGFFDDTVPWRIPKEWIDSFPYHLFQTVIFENTTAVFVLGSLRGGEATWNTLYRHVLDVNHADLIVVVVGKIPSTSSLLTRAKFVFQIPHFTDWAVVLEIMAKEGGNERTWRRSVSNIIGDASILLGYSSIGGQGNLQRGSGALLFSVRWILREFIKENHFTSVYNRFVLTRSDLYYVCSDDFSKLLPTSKIFIPSGEDYGGICDRHVICSASDVLSVLNILPPLLHYPERYTKYQSDSFFNTEQFFKLRLNEMNLSNNIERYPRTMFIAGIDGDSWTWMPLTANTLPEGVHFKYDIEYAEAKQTCFNYAKQNLSGQHVSAFNLSPPIGLAIWDGKHLSGWACDLDNPWAQIDIQIVVLNFMNINLGLNNNNSKTRKRVIHVRANMVSEREISYICNGGQHHTFFQKIPPPGEDNLHISLYDTARIQVFAIDPLDLSFQVKLLDTPFIFIPVTNINYKSMS